jgi:hypothetical protein
MDLLQQLVRIHRDQDWTALVQFWGVIAACIVFVCLQLLVWRSKKAGTKALEVTRKLTDDVRALERRLEDLEHSIQERLEARPRQSDMPTGRGTRSGQPPPPGESQGG